LFVRPAPAGAPSAVRLGLGQQVAAGYQNLMRLGASHFLLGNYEAAIEFSLKSLTTFNGLVTPMSASPAAMPRSSASMRRRPWRAASASSIRR
jgi:hypothetical protein